MKINRGETVYLSLIHRIQSIEQFYGSTYIGDFCVKDRRGGWSETPVMVFYQPEPKSPEHSNYFGIYTSVSNGIMICDASSTANIPIAGVESGGEVIYSRFRHDMRTTADRLASIDGGRNYTKRMGGGRDLTLAILDGVLQVVDDPESLYVQQRLSTS